MKDILSGPEDKEWKDTVAGPENWNAFALKLIRFAGQNRLIAFQGPMGAGKTTLIRELCRQLEVTDMVASPSFAIVYEYITGNKSVVYHLDFFRIRDLEEVYDMGYEEYFFSGNWCFVEWPGKVRSVLPAQTIWVDIQVDEAGKRQVRVSKP